MAAWQDTLSCNNNKINEPMGERGIGLHGFSDLMVEQTSASQLVDLWLLLPISLKILLVPLDGSILSHNLSFIWELFSSSRLTLTMIRNQMIDIGPS